MRIHTVLGLAAMLAAGAQPSGSATKNDEAKLLRAADRMAATASELRGLKPKTPIRKEIKNRAELSQILKDKVRADHPSDRMRREEAMLQTLGLIPEGIGYEETATRLHTEQIEAFYDSGRKTLFLADWLTAADQEHTWVHEASLALRDQHFDIGGILKDMRVSADDDRALARRAFLEGDGTAVMLQHILNPHKRHFADLPNLAFVMETQMEAMRSHYTVLKNAPRFLQETFAFPYGYGARFLQQVWKQRPSWETINAIYADLPTSTEQILHPEKYFGLRDNSHSVDAESFAARLKDGWSVVHKRVMGEFSLGLLLSLHLTEERSRRAVCGWGGDQAVLVENVSGKRAVLISTTWDTADDAEKFFTAMDAWFLQRNPQAERNPQADRRPGTQSVTLVQDALFHSLKRENASVRIIIGLPEPDFEKLADF